MAVNKNQKKVSLKELEDEKAKAADPDNCDEEGNNEASAKKKKPKADDTETDDECDKDAEDGDEEECEKPKKSKKKPAKKDNEADDETDVDPEEESDDDGDEEECEGTKSIDVKDPTQVRTFSYSQIKRKDGSIAVRKWKGTADDLLKKAHFPHAYNKDFDTFEVHYGCSARAVSRSAPDESSSEVKSKAAGGTNTGAGNAATDFQPTEDEYKQIRVLMNGDYPPEHIKVMEGSASDGQYDRHGEKFSRKASRRQVDLSYDQPMIEDHNYYKSAGVIGKFFDGLVKTVASGYDVRLKFFMLCRPGNQREQDVFDGFKSGINNKLSVGVRIKRKDYICDVCGIPMFMIKGEHYEWCGHYVGMELKDGTPVTATIDNIIDFLECSRVTVPAQKFAAVRSSGAPTTDAELTGRGKSIINAEVPATLENPKAVLADISKVISSRKSFTTEECRELFLGKSQINDGARITIVNKGDVSMPADNTEKEKTGAQAEDTKSVTELETLKLAHARVLKDAGAATLQFNESLTKIVETITKMTEASKALTESAEQVKKANETSETVLGKHIEENHQFGVFLAKVLADFGLKCGIVVGKSNDDIARMEANTKSVDHRQDVQAEKANAADATKFYAGITDRF